MIIYKHKLSENVLNELLSIQELGLKINRKTKAIAEAGLKKYDDNEEYKTFMKNEGIEIIMLT